MIADLGELRRIGGVSIKWDDPAFAREYTVDVSIDGGFWTTVKENIWLGKQSSCVLRGLFNNSDVCDL